MFTLPQCKSESDFIKVGECPLDPGGYFIIKVWPVVEGRTMAGAADSLFPGYREGHHVAGAAEQKQNHHRERHQRFDPAPLRKDKTLTQCVGFVKATVTSHSHQNKSRTSVVMKNGCFYVDHNRCFLFPSFTTMRHSHATSRCSFNDPIPLAIMMKAMGTECDQEIVQLVGSDDFYQVTFACAFYKTLWHLTCEQLELAASLAEAANLDVFTQMQVVFMCTN